MISIIVPIYNVETYLKECLDSLYKLNIPHMEIILIDDGSTDKSYSIAEEYAKNILKKLFLSKRKMEGFLL